MSRLSYKGWSINCRPLKDIEGNWQLELERGEVLHTFTMSKLMTLVAVVNFSYDRIDEYVEDLKKS